MKKLILCISMLLTIELNAQESKFVAVSAAYDKPVYNFTFKEAVSGETRSLHTPLNEGKYVVGYYAAYWCSICHDLVLSSFNSTIIKKWQADYPNKFEVWADIYDGDNGTAATSKKNKGWGSEVFAFYAGNNIFTTPFSCHGAPGFLIIEPGTKKVVLFTSDLSEMFSTLKQLIEGKYQNPNMINNLALRKKITTTNMLDRLFVPEALTDGLDGNPFTTISQEELDFTLDLEGNASIKEIVIKSHFNSGINFKLSVSDKAAGPWKLISTVGTPANRELFTLSNLQEQARYIRFQRDNGKINIREFIVKGTMNITANEDELDSNSELAIYPNPSNGLMNISYSDGNDLQIEILDMMGKSVFRQHTISGQKPVDLSHLEKGIYYLMATSNRKTFKKKIVIK